MKRIICGFLLCLCCSLHADIDSALAALDRVLEPLANAVKVSDIPQPPMGPGGIPTPPPMGPGGIPKPPTGRPSTGVNYDKFAMYKDIVVNAPEDIKKLYKKISPKSLGQLDKIYKSWKTPSGSISGKEASRLRENFKIFGCFKDFGSRSVQESDYCSAKKIDVENILKAIASKKNISDWQVKDILEKAIKGALKDVSATEVCDVVGKMIKNEKMRTAYCQLDSTKRDVIVDEYKKLKKVVSKGDFKAVFEKLSEKRLDVLKSNDSDTIIQKIKDWRKVRRAAVKKAQKAAKEKKSFIDKLKPLSRGDFNLDSMEDSFNALTKRSQALFASIRQDLIKYVNNDMTDDDFKVKYKSRLESILKQKKLSEDLVSIIITTLPEDMHDSFNELVKKKIVKGTKKTTYVPEEKSTDTDKPFVPKGTKPKKGTKTSSGFVKLLKQAQKDFKNSDVNPLQVGMKPIVDKTVKDVRSIDQEAMEANRLLVRSALKALKKSSLTPEQLLVCSKLLLILNPASVSQVIKLLQEKNAPEGDIYTLINAVYTILIERVKFAKSDLAKGTKGACFDLELVLSYPVLLSSFRNDLIYKKEKGKSLTPQAEAFLSEFESKGKTFFDLAKKVSKCIGVKIDDVRRVAEWDKNRKWCKITFVDFFVADPVRGEMGRYLPGSRDEYGKYKFKKLSKSGEFTLSDILDKDRQDNPRSYRDEKSYYRCFDADINDILKSIVTYENLQKKAGKALYNFSMLFEKQKILNAIKAFYANITNPSVCEVCLNNDLKFVTEKQLGIIKKFLQSLAKKAKSIAVENALKQLADILYKKQNPDWNMN